MVESAIGRSVRRKQITLAPESINSSRIRGAAKCGQVSGLEAANQWVETVSLCRTDVDPRDSN